jgi:hypothetical protein
VPVATPRPANSRSSDDPSYTAIGFYERLGFIHNEQWLAYPEERLAQ